MNHSKLSARGYKGAERNIPPRLYRKHATHTKQQESRRLLGEPPFLLWSHFYKLGTDINTFAPLSIDGHTWVLNQSSANPCFTLSEICIRPLF